tara:strand:+ start:7898 stop:8164 length:267 start_codon:yes stop_codon:yes gene_type:complete
MSRCLLESEEHEVVIGWDAPIGSFYLQVLEPEGDEPLLWEGNGRRIHTTPDALIMMAEKFAKPFDQGLLLNELMKDQARDLERQSRRP